MDFKRFGDSKKKTSDPFWLIFAGNDVITRLVFWIDKRRRFGFLKKQPEVQEVPSWPLRTQSALGQPSTWHSFRFLFHHSKLTNRNICCSSLPMALPFKIGDLMTLHQTAPWSPPSTTKMLLHLLHLNDLATESSHRSVDRSPLQPRSFGAAKFCFFEFSWRRHESFKQIDHQN